jgi:glucan phosphoethanolaminetransferase (alkaline phosphatase superfamily)
MKSRMVFYIFSIIGFFFPYVLKFLMMSPNENLKIFAIYALGKFNILYFAVIIIFFFVGLREKFSYLRIAQVIFVSVYLGYVLISYFILAKIHVQNYVKEHNLKAKIVTLGELKNYPNFKIYYKEANYAAIKILPKQKKELPFNYKKDRAQ